MGSLRDGDGAPVTAAQQTEVEQMAASLLHHRKHGICICEHNEEVCGVHSCQSYFWAYVNAWRSLYRVKPGFRVRQLATRWQQAQTA